MVLTHVAVEGFQIKIQLAEIFRLKLADLQFNRNEAVQATMKEEQVQREISPTNLNRIFGADETEVPSQLDQKHSELFQQAAMQICFGMDRWETEKFQVIGILENAECFRVCLSHHWRDFWRTEHCAFKECTAKLTFKLARAPPLLDRKPYVELSFPPNVCSVPK